MSKAEQPWVKWYWSDWRSDPGLRMCSLAARGLWAELLAIMQEAAPYGHLLVNGTPPTAKQIASIAGAPPKVVASLLADLEAAGVFSRTEDGVIFSRRMVRDRQRDTNNRIAGLAGGNPEIARGTVPKELRARPFKRSDAPAKTRRIFEAAGGKCHWCQCELQWGGGGPDTFQVDHVVAIRDGGTNDDDNLVASCARCNHQRARVPTATPLAVGTEPDNGSDPKAQKPEARSQKPEQPVEAAQAPPPQRRRGMRLPDDWEPTPAVLAFAEQRGWVGEPLQTEVLKFRNYWTAKAGAGATKLDWDRTFCNWLLTARRPAAAATGFPTTDELMRMIG